MEARSPSGIRGRQPAGGFSPRSPMRWRVATHATGSSACAPRGPWPGLFYSLESDAMAYKRILVPVDGSPTSGLGLREAIAFAKAQKARLQLVHVVDVHNALTAGAESGAYLADLVSALKQRGRQILAKAAQLARKAGVACDSVLLETLTGPAAEPILRQAKKARVDLIVMGTHGRRGLRRLVMGSDAEQIVRNAPVPVMLVRGKRR